VAKEKAEFKIAFLSGARMARPTDFSRSEPPNALVVPFRIDLRRVA